MNYFEECVEKSAKLLAEILKTARKRGLERGISNEIEAYRILAQQQRLGNLDCIVNYEVAVKAFNLLPKYLRQARC